jgi:hypothetical protein
MIDPANLSAGSRQVQSGGSIGPDAATGQYDTGQGEGGHDHPGMAPPDQFGEPRGNTCNSQLSGRD